MSQAQRFRFGLLGESCEAFASVAITGGVLGAVVQGFQRARFSSTALIIDFSFLLLLAMALPNILGLFILGGDVSKGLNEYLEKLKSGELDREAIRD